MRNVFEVQILEVILSMCDIITLSLVVLVDDNRRILRDLRGNPEVAVGSPSLREC